MPRGFSINKDSKFLASNGTILTTQLFVIPGELEPHPNALYTMAREDITIGKIKYPSLYHLYKKCNDITEASFVDKYFHGWEQWEKIASNPLYSNEISRWRNDLKHRVLGSLINTLIVDASSNSKSSKSSAKFLVEKLSKGKPGKPTTSVLPTTEESARSVTFAIAHDAQRLKLVT